MRKIFTRVMAVVPVLLVLACGSAPAPAPAPAPAAPALSNGTIILDGATAYTVVKGDTLSRIAARTYGGSNMYYFPLISLANPEVVQDPDVLAVGTRLTVPNLQRNLNDAGAVSALREGMIAAAALYERRNQPKSAANLRNLARKLPE